MKILLLSDIHSNMRALEAVEAQEKDWDCVWFAGDMLDAGFQPHEVVDWMRRHNAVAVLGNHDDGVLDRIRRNVPMPEDPYHAKSFGMHNRMLLTQEDIAFLQTLPIGRQMEADGVTYYMVHDYTGPTGEPTANAPHALLHELMEYRVCDAFNQYWAEKVGTTQGKRCLIVGHTHHCLALQVMQDAMVLNPGSLAFRCGSDVRAKGGDYMVIEDGAPYFRRVLFDTAEDYNTVLRCAFDENERNAGLSIFGV